MALTADSDTRVPTQAAVKAYIAAQLAKSGGGAGLTVEQVQDIVAAMFGGSHSGITFNYDDAGNIINATVTVTGGAEPIQTVNDLALLPANARVGTFYWFAIPSMGTQGLYICSSNTDGNHAEWDEVFVSRLSKVGIANLAQDTLDAIAASGGGTSADVAATMIANGMTLTPIAPTFASKDAAARTYTITSVLGHAPDQHEYNLRVAGYVPVPANAQIPVGTAALNAGDLLVRVKARPGVNTGAIHSNTETLAASGKVGGAFVSWGQKSGNETETAATGSLARNTANLDFYATTVQTILPTENKSFEFELPTGIDACAFFLIPKGTGAFTYPQSVYGGGGRGARDAGVSAALAIKFPIDVTNPANGAEYQQGSEVANAAGVKYRLGFDGAGRLKYQANTGAGWVTKALDEAAHVTPTEPYCLSITNDGKQGAASMTNVQIVTN